MITDKEQIMIISGNILERVETLITFTILTAELVQSYDDRRDWALDDICLYRIHHFFVIIRTFFYVLLHVLSSALRTSFVERFIYKFYQGTVNSMIYAVIKVVNG